jgi:drug/metabolite transporter (DMT)-like permease
LGLLNPVAYYLILFKSYSLLPAQVAQPINYVWPILLTVLLALFSHRAIPRVKYIGLFISLCGVAFISLGSSEIEHLHLSAFGLFLAVFSALLWATYWLITDKEKEKADATMSLFLCFFFGSVYLVAAAAVIGIHPITLQGLLSGMYVGGFEMGIPFIAFGYALGKTTNPALINQMCYLAPFPVAVLHRHGAGRTHRGDHLCGIGTDCRRNLIQSIWRKFEVKEIILP